MRTAFASLPVSSLLAALRYPSLTFLFVTSDSLPFLIRNTLDLNLTLGFRLRLHSPSPLLLR